MKIRCTLPLFLLLFLTGCTPYTLHETDLRSIPYTPAIAEEDIMSSYLAEEPFEEHFTPLPDGKWKCSIFKRPVLDGNGETVELYTIHTVLDKNGDVLFPMELREHTYLYLELEDETVLRIYRVPKSEESREERWLCTVNGVELNRRESPEIADLKTASMLSGEHYKGSTTKGGYYLTDSYSTGWYPHPIKYALYRGTECLTECKYDDIFLTSENGQDVFVATYSEEDNTLKTDILAGDGSLLRTENGEPGDRYTKIPYEIPPDGYPIVQDTVSGKYFYNSPDGTPLCEPMFDACTEIVNGTSVVRMDEKIYVFQVNN